ncbi:MAG: hypothetical protein IJF87_04010 [Erysipelotrichaceae bacterium]|nr:hypothetical protein [Erysipelotrichaceae bacterium]
MMQKLTEYLRSIEDPVSSFLYCANVDCPAFRRQNEGKANDQDYEDMTFFRACVQNILCNKKAMSLLEETSIIMANEEPGHSEISLYYVLVSYPEDKYTNAKKTLQELLN